MRQRPGLPKHLQIPQHPPQQPNHRMITFEQSSDTPLRDHFRLAQFRL